MPCSRSSKTTQARLSTSSASLPASRGRSRIAPVVARIGWPRGEGRVGRPGLLFCRPDRTRRAPHRGGLRHHAGRNPCEQRWRAHSQALPAGCRPRRRRSRLCSRPFSRGSRKSPERATTCRLKTICRSARPISQVARRTPFLDELPRPDVGPLRHDRWKSCVTPLPPFGSVRARRTSCSCRSVVSPA